MTGIPGNPADATPHNTAEQLVEEHRHHDRRALTPKLSPVRQFLLWSTVLALLGTGAGWLWAEYLYQGVEGGIEAYEIKHYAMVLHAGFALLFVFLAGSLLHTHMQTAWRQARNRASGLLMVLTALLLALSGYGLWYAGGELLRTAAELTHWITGFGIPLLLLVHALLGKRRPR